MLVVSAEGVRYALVSHAQAIKPLTNVTFELTGTLPVDTTLLPYTGSGADGELIHAGTNIAGIGPAYMFVATKTGRELLVPVSDLNGKTKPTTTY